MRGRSGWVALMLAVTLSGCAATQARVPHWPDEPSRSPSPPAPPALPEPPPLHPPDLIEILSPNHNGRKGAGISAIVLHHTASPADAQAIARWFQRRQARVSSHYVVDRDGTIVRCVPDHRRAWHAGPSVFRGRTNVNDFSLGIEICNKGDGIEPYPPEQVQAVTRLVAWLAQRHGIPLSRVTRHRDVIRPAGIKNDPSDNFPFFGVVTMAEALLEGGTRAATGQHPPGRPAAAGS